MKPFDIRERTFHFAIDTIRYCKIVQDEQKEFILTKQLIRSSTSVGANVRESKNAESRADFIHKLSIAQKECDESLYWLELIQAYSEVDSVTMNKLKSENIEILKIIKTIILRTKENTNWKKK